MLAARFAGDALWCTKTMLVQAGSHVALVHRGRLRQVSTLFSQAVAAAAVHCGRLRQVCLPRCLGLMGGALLWRCCRLLPRSEARVHFSLRCLPA